MSLFRFDFTIFHVPCKELTTADALSHAPSNATSRVKQEEEIELYVENILLQLLASDKRLEQIATAQKEDPICRKVFEYSKEGGQTWSRSFQVRSVHTGLQEARFLRGKDFSSKALVSLLRHR